jgi:ubiquinone/menaquinone biosynthesis C-methylase UbiE
MNNILLQYNGEPAKLMSNLFDEMALKSTNHFRQILQEQNISGNILDIGFGEGTDLTYYQQLGLSVHGIDPSEDFFAIASKKITADLRLENSEKTTFSDDYFDVVVSKYVLQTLPYLDQSYCEVARILKPKGIFQFLIVHPMRQYFEKKDITADYFEKTYVESMIYDGAFVVVEPTHTLQEVLSKTFLELFEVSCIAEADDYPASERIDGRLYPSYLIVQARKK